LSYVTKYADPQINPTLAGRELGTDGVLHGSLLRADQKLRVTAQLIDTKAGGVLWAGKFDLTFEDSIGVVDTVCQCILRGLSGRQRTGPLELLQDHDEEIRLDGVQSLRYSHDPRAAELLARTLADPNIRIRAAAAEALGQLGKTAAPIVASCIEDATDQGDYMTARFAAKAAGLIGSAEALAPLLDALSNEDSLLASEAALALGNLSDERALPDLLDALVRDDANVRFTAAQALGTLEHPGALEALEARIREDEDEGVRAKAQWAATRIRRRLERDDTGVPSSWPARDLVESESLR
jgi:HEAT repeat protein